MEWKNRELKYHPLLNMLLHILVEDIVEVIRNPNQDEFCNKFDSILNTEIPYM